MPSPEAPRCRPGDVQRQTRDLDFFGLTGAAVDRLVPAVELALRTAGLAVHRIQVNPGFARLVVESGDDRTELDLAADARLFPAEPGEPAPMLSGEELAVDKLLALYNDHWRDDRPLTLKEFMDHLRLCSINVSAGSGAELWYDDGTLFLGHSVVVSLDAEGRYTRSHLAG